MEFGFLLFKKSFAIFSFVQTTFFSSVPAISLTLCKEDNNRIKGVLNSNLEFGACEWPDDLNIFISAGLVNLLVESAVNPSKFTYPEDFFLKPHKQQAS